MKRPNIVFCFIDDMGCQDITCAGSSFYETPNIDAMKEQGMLFTQSYASCPVCSPSRASVMTGKYPARLGVTDWIDNSGEYHPCKGRVIDAPYIKHLPSGETTIAKHLQNLGYSTWHVGKWHLGTEDYYPNHFGFDVNIGGCDWGNPKKGYFSPYSIETLPNGPIGEFLTDRLTDEAISLIRQGGEKPFFLNLWHYAVHTPIQAKQKDITYFEEKAKLLGLDKLVSVVEGEYFEPEHKRNERVRRRIIQSDPVYAALIYNLDQNFGRLIEALKETGKLENTLIVFSSDNGGLSSAEGSPTCNLPYREGKGWTYEGGLRVPMVAFWQGHIKPGSLCNIPVTTPDLFCTFLEAAAGKTAFSSEIDGVSLLPVFSGEGIKERPIFWHYPHYGNQGGTPGAALRLGDYKLVEFFTDDLPELYNIKRDPWEKENLSEIMPEKLLELHEILRAWQQDICAVFPKRNMDYTPKLLM